VIVIHTFLNKISYISISV